ncbi:MAG: hypothetical protein DWB56_06895 [Candidatus Jettenia sp.]|uniref:HTH cro/C1-type domain-containing protein n=1 Tax=Candidatus Jettenia caeni TaxID=247490 RepID=I3IMX2_9BACT|nr:XRE family transcriptional regulator [Candidatus Jettenia sp. AMX1]MBC6928681.1 hypothetical protein [Candidatus Jettenia sp.]NUN23432.1 hypothetical protein [Candidatus Jettenia caeni]KAA0250659.1 MAG: hypothetical protein EDM77_03835 [Candidatus Jettenia sp. AMX1]MCE7879993.1 hypothetical protein [Candidatus Jettenia sp. AMX1]MCQ3926775.1 hypothetical protein [Candidatus Jettenia sp.]
MKNQEFINNLHKILKEKYKGNVSKFALAAGINYGTLRTYLKRGSKPNPDILKKLANAAGMTTDELYPTGMKYEGIEPALLKKSRPIPVISWVKAGGWTETCETFRPEDAESWIQSDVSGECIFALRVKGDSMEDLFYDGDIIIVNPHIQPEIGDFVIVKNHQEECTFKQLKKYGDKYVLRPLNEKYQEMEVKKDEFRIVGVVVEKRRRFR